MDKWPRNNWQKINKKEGVLINKGLFLIFVMKIGYKIQDGFIEYYYEDCTVLCYRALGNKRIKPERIYKYGQKRKFDVHLIPVKELEELLSGGAKWFEIKQNKTKRWKFKLHFSL